MNLHTLYAVNVATTTVALLIDQIEQFGVDPRIQEVLQSADGQVDPSFLATMGQDPRISFTTSDLAAVLATSTSKLLINGLLVDSDLTHAGVQCFFQKIAEGGTRTAGANHIKMTTTEGLLVPRQLTARQGAVATLAMELLTTYDGTNNPIQIATSQSLVGTPSVSTLHTLGPVMINGVQLTGIQEMTYDAGIQEVVQAADGQPWPTFAGIMSRQPMFSITTTETVSLSTFGIYGAAQGATDSIIYLRALAAGGTRDADDAGTHISLKIDAGMIRVRQISGGQGQPQMSRIEIRPTWDGSNDIVVVDTAASISLA